MQFKRCPSGTGTNTHTHTHRLLYGQLIIGSYQSIWNWYVELRWEM